MTALNIVEEKLGSHAFDRLALNGQTITSTTTKKDLGESKPRFTNFKINKKINDESLPLFGQEMKNVN